MHANVRDIFWTTRYISVLPLIMPGMCATNN